MLRREVHWLRHGAGVDVELDDRVVGSFGFDGGVVKDLFDPLGDRFALLRFTGDGEPSAAVLFWVHDLGYSG